MGFFGGVRRAASKDHSVSDNILLPSQKSSVVLANLFTDEDPIVDHSTLTTSSISFSVGAQPSNENETNSNNKNVHSISINPNQPSDHHLPLPSSSSSTSSSTASFAVSSNPARKAKESMSRLVKRESIKRSLSRKMARSENRRQALNLRDQRMKLSPNDSISPHAVAHVANAQPKSKSKLKSKPTNINNGNKQSIATLDQKLSSLTMSPVTPALARDDDNNAGGGNDGSGNGKNDNKEHDYDKNHLNNDALLDNAIVTPPHKLNEDLSPTLDQSPSSSAFSLEAATFAFPETLRATKSPNSTSSKPRSRRRPPPLGTQGRATDSAGDWPSVGGVFASDGGFTTGGFRITAEGVLNKPDLETREDSDPEGDDQAPRSEALVIVRALKEFRNGPTIGGGAAGRVHLAEHTPSKTMMAIKVVNVYNKEKRIQLLKELETLCTHVSRYLVRFHGAFYDGSGAVHIALEYMDHGCLASFVQRVGPIPERIVQMIAQDCLRGLRFLHHHHVLHRDFKTANILLSRKLCRAKLSDFGLARDLHPGVSKVDTFVGTVAYMSPERLQGAKYTYASDIWALGVSMVECLIGRHPFNKPQNYFDYIEATAASGTLQGFDDRENHFSSQAHDFIAQCLYTDPKKRPNATNLLDHPWIKGAKRSCDEFGAWLDEARSISMRVVSQK